MGPTSASLGAGLQFRILGSLQIVVGEREVALDSPLQRRLLGALLIDVGSAVSADHLAETLWGDDQPEHPAGAVQTHVSRLRTLLGREGGPQARDALVTRAPGYALAVDPWQVDATRFEHLVADAQSAPTPQSAANMLQDALRLWRGRPLAEFDHDRARTEAERLEQLRSAAVARRAEALLTMGSAAEAAVELDTAVARHPLDEHLRGLLMVALVRSGRQADALATYRDLRDVLVEELGVEPSATLRRLERAILQQDPDLPWPAPGSQTGPRVAAWDQEHEDRAEPLPEPLTSLLGRDADVHGVAATLQDGRIVVLTGVGGVGKSRLALRVAHQVADDYPDGVRLCDLASIDDSGAVADVVATTLGVLPSGTDTIEDALVTALRAQRMLLVLDNCEHVVDRAAQLTDQIARRCPEVDVLATSRHPLGVPGERLWPVEPLAVGDNLDGPAVALFRERATAANPTLTVDDQDLQAIAEICQRLDGLPLAIELAAARVRSMTPADIAGRLDDRFSLLSSPARAATSRHHSLQAIVDWSYAQLVERSRLLFERLAVFAGGFGLDSIEEVCTGHGLSEQEVAGRLADLVDHSLVAMDRTGRHARYRLLETLRAYGWARLEERGELQTWRERHAEHVTTLSEAAGAGLQGPDEGRWADTVDAELGNIRTAMAWSRERGRVDLALRLAASMRTYAYYRLHDETYDWALHALEMPGATEQPAYAAALVTAGIGLMQRGHMRPAQDHAEQALVTGGDDAVVLRARRLQAEVMLYTGRLQETERLGREIVRDARGAGRTYDEAFGHLYQVFAAIYAGRTADALGLLEAGWPVARRTLNPTVSAGFWFLEGEVRLDADPDAALAAFQRVIQIAEPVHNRFLAGVARVSSASLEARHGAVDRALPAFREIIDHWRRSGDWAHMWTTLHNLVVLLERAGATEAATVLLGAVEAPDTGVPAFGEDAARLNAIAETLSASLGTEEFTRNRERGRRMNDDEAVQYALDEIGRLVAQPAGAT